MLLRLSISAGDEKGVRRCRPVLPDQLQDDLGGRARCGEGFRHRIRQGKLRERDSARGRRSGEEEVKQLFRWNVNVRESAVLDLAGAGSAELLVTFVRKRII